MRRGQRESNGGYISGTAYYDDLYRVSTTGEWEPWLEFFLVGVREQSEDAISRARALRDLHDDYRQRLQAVGASANALQLADELFPSPIVTRRKVADLREVTGAGARLIVEKLEEVGILQSIDDTRPQLFMADELVDLLQ